MSRTTLNNEIDIRKVTAFCRRLAIAASILAAAAGCAAPAPTADPEPAPMAQSVQHTSADIHIRLVGILSPGDKGALVLDPGWREYIIAVENRGKRPLTIQNVKLLTSAGRYLDSASSYGQIIVPPDTASEVAGSVAKRAAGVAAGQVIPYGGSIVGIITSAVSASAAEDAAKARREFDQRKLKNLELAPGGKAIGSAFLPQVANPRALVLDHGHHDDIERIEIPLPRMGT